MADTSLLTRLDGIEARFEEVATLITAPDVIADMKRYVRLTKEYKELQRLTEATARYRSLLADIDDSRELLESESDPELRQMAREQLDNAQQAIPAMEEDIHILSAGAPGAESVPLYFTFVYFYVKRLCFGQNCNSGSRSVHAALCLGCGHALHTVYPTFVFQYAVNAVTCDA